jgi:hypothetical protein
MTDFSITPPPELVTNWILESDIAGEDTYEGIATRAAQWGADQELEACCEWFQEFYKTESWVKHDLKHFRAARRPKPPSLKEQALAELAEWENVMDIASDSPIRRALEALPE